MLVVPGSRIGRFAPDDTSRNLSPRNPWFVTVGLFTLYTGFWGFYMSFHTPMVDVLAGDGVFFSATTIYGTPTTLSGVTLNCVMPPLAGYWASKGTCSESIHADLPALSQPPPAATCITRFRRY